MRFNIGSSVSIVTGVFVFYIVAVIIVDMSNIRSSIASAPQLERTIDVSNPQANAVRSTIFLDAVTITSPRNFRVGEDTTVKVEVWLQPYVFSIGDTQFDGQTNTMFTDPPRIEDAKAYAGEYDISLTSGKLSPTAIHPSSRQRFNEPAEDTSFSERLVWVWSISADAPGERSILIHGLPAHSLDRHRRTVESADAYEGLEWVVQENDGARVRQTTSDEYSGFIVMDFHSTRSLRIPIQVLSDSGLTARQESYLSLSKLLVGLIGGVIGWSIWKMLPLFSRRRQHVKIHRPFGDRSQGTWRRTQKRR